MDWQTIESAPKDDGAWLLGLHHFAGVIPMVYCGTFERWETPDQNFSLGHEEPYEWYPVEPTHWMPLPDPPA